MLVSRVFLFSLVSVSGIALATATATATALPTVLVVMDEALTGSHAEYSAFFETIRFNRAFEVDRYLVHDKTAFQAPPLISPESNDLNYHSVYLLSSELPQPWNTDASLVTFVERGGNLLVALDVRATQQGRRKREEWLALLANFGVELLASGSEVTQLSAAATDLDLTWNQAHSITRKHETPLKAPVLGTGFRLKRKPVNALVHPLWMLSSGMAFCAKNKCSSSSSVVAVAVAHESRHGARFMAVGSPTFLTATKPSTALASWLQKQEAVAAIASVTHALHGSAHKNRGASPTGATFYREGDGVDVRVCLSDTAASTGPVQVELKLMEMVARHTATFDAQDGCFHVVDMRLPRSRGVYTLIVEHLRPGHSLLQHKERLAVRPVREDERDRPGWVMLAHVLSWMLVTLSSMFVLLPMLIRSTTEPSECLWRRSGDE